MPVSGVLASQLNGRRDRRVQEGDEAATRAHGESRRHGMLQAPACLRHNPVPHAAPIARASGRRVQALAAGAARAIFDEVSYCDEERDDSVRRARYYGMVR